MKIISYCILFFIFFISQAEGQILYDKEFDSNSAIISNPFLSYSYCGYFSYKSYGYSPERSMVYEIYGKDKILGIDCTILKYTHISGGVLDEDSLYWLAQDISGNVWILKYHDIITDEIHDGSQGKEPVLYMPGSPEVGQRFMETPGGYYYEVLSTDTSITTSLYDTGSLTDCMVARAYWDESDYDTYYYCQGVGLVQEPHEEMGQAPRGYLLDEQTCNGDVQQFNTSMPPATAPTLTIDVTGLTVFFKWSPVENAEGYRFFYAPYPSADPILSVDLGNSLELKVTLWEGAAYYIAVQSYNGTGDGPFSNVVNFTVSSGITSLDNLSGEWNGSWQSRYSDYSGSVHLMLQNNNGQISGFMDVQTYTSCDLVEKVPISGIAQGDVAEFNASYDCNGMLAKISFAKGIIEGQNMTGDFEISVNGSLYSAGTFSLNR